MLASTLENWFLKRRLNPWVSLFALALLFSLIGIFLSLQTKVGFVALFIVSIGVLPVIVRRISLSELLAGRTITEQKQGARLEEIQLQSYRWSVSRFLKDFGPVFETYLVYFIAVFVLFVALGTLLNPETVFKVFEGQVGTFNPLNSAVMIEKLVINNLGVLILGFLFSLVFEFGALFVVARNAVFWGLTFGVFAQSFSATPFFLLLVLPHIFLEASAYFASSIAGGVLSKAIVEEKTDSERLYSLFTQVIALLLVSIALLVLAGIVEAAVFNAVLPRL